MPQYRFVPAALLFLLASPLSADPASEGRQHLLTDTFQTISKVSALPATVRSEFARHSQQPRFEMANPGAPFQVTDVITKSGLPWRRLIFGGKNQNYCFLHYERGGIAHSYAVALFRLSGKTAKFVWGAHGRSKLTDLKALRDAMRNGELPSAPSRGYW